MMTRGGFQQLEVAMKTMPVLIASFAAALFAPAVAAQHDHAHEHGDNETLGTVDFPTSCRPEVAAAFTRSVALLHSMGYAEARKGFESVAEKDPACGMAHWGAAMTYYHPIWAPPTPPELAAGSASAAKAAELGAKTERERAYISAVSAFYRDADRLDHKARAQAFRQAMEDVVRRFPGDDEAAIFHALTLLATAPSSDTTFANQKKAAEILNALLPKHPNHPGIAHYVIHSFDYPALAEAALPAAHAYAKIAPSSPHALHMPSHIFTRLGLWRESIASNDDSAEAGRRLVAKRHPGAASFDTLHALDYLEYAYLQIDDQPKARQVLEEAARAKTFDEPNFAAGYALAAIPARWALERRDWKAAAALELPAVELQWQRYPYIPAITHFAQAIGAARSDQPERARKAVEKLEQIHAGLVKSPIPGPYDWGSHVESMRLAAAAWLARASGQNDEALALGRSAAELDEKTGKHPVTPGMVLPPRELLGDMLLESNRPAEALIEYEAALRQAPRRFNTMFGAARAAERAGKADRAAKLYRELVEMTGDGARRPELKDARRFLADRR
jgi:tetratricopeptide (TPR) repeat protein